MRTILKLDVHDEFVLLLLNSLQHIYFSWCALQTPLMWLGCIQTCSLLTTVNSCTTPTPCPRCPGQSWRRLTSLWSIEYLIQVGLCFCANEIIVSKCDEETQRFFTYFSSYLYSYFGQQKRSHLVKQLNDADPFTTSPLMEGTPTIRSRKKLLQIIDTTLLKCYLHVKTKHYFHNYIHLFIFCVTYGLKVSVKAILKKIKF